MNKASAFTKIIYRDILHYIKLSFIGVSEKCLFIKLKTNCDHSDHGRRRREEGREPTPLGKNINHNDKCRVESYVVYT